MNSSRRLEQFVLVATMFIGSIVLWLGTPFFWIWLAGRTSKVSASSMNSLLMVLIGIPVTMIIIGKLLAKVDHRYTASFGIHEVNNTSLARVFQAVKGGKSEKDPSMLEKIMVLSISLAVLCLGVWFIFFSHGSAARGS